MIPRLASSGFGSCSPSIGTILNFCSILVNIKNSSCLAKLSPRQIRLPEKLTCQIHTIHICLLKYPF